ncbi:nuclear pore complex protein Nup93 [Culex quinquefasciatus]|uniref:Nuclear pore protein n=1 Tax=Culex quinquefasciatus TaxID=7176 RepID=B0WDM6_CULQU|nr:nuclear pore complex protein Nup93 [Culex quinquefasciatus]|eukprot:XP_001846810.1 nuclear pore complex protein Nup93 [Culex quinquefasciatus]
MIFAHPSDFEVRNTKKDVEMDFSALLQQAQKLSHDTQVSDDLPRVERTLTQVLQATQELHSRVSQTGTFLRNEKENAILSVTEEVHKNSLQAAQNAKWEHTMNDWKLEKVKLINALVGPSQNWMDIRKGPEQTTLNESTFGGRSSLNNQKMAYAREVYEYNKLINEGAMRPSLVQRFAQVADGFNDSKVSDIWEIMKYMPSVKPNPRTQDPLRARCTQTQFIEQAKRYLENRYKLFMQTVIAEHLRDAQRGGISSILNLVGSFVGLKFANQNQNLCL